VEAREIKTAVNGFDDDEIKRVSEPVRLVVRDRQIRTLFETLKERNGSKNAILMLADKYFLSEDQIDFIVYPRRRETREEKPEPLKSKANSEQKDLFE